jgi:hypothetical protein
LRFFLRGGLVTSTGVGRFFSCARFFCAPAHVVEGSWQILQPASTRGCRRVAAGQGQAYIRRPCSATRDSRDLNSFSRSSARFRILLTNVWACDMCSRGQVVANSLRFPWTCSNATDMTRWRFARLSRKLRESAMTRNLLPCTAPGSSLVGVVPVARSGQALILARRPILGQCKNVSVRMSLFARVAIGNKASRNTHRLMQPGRQVLPGRSNLLRRVAMIALTRCGAQRSRNARGCTIGQVQTVLRGLPYVHGETWSIEFRSKCRSRSPKLPTQAPIAPSGVTGF